MIHGFDEELFYKKIQECSLSKDYTEITNAFMQLSRNQIIEVIDKFDLETHFVESLKKAGVNKYLSSMLFIVLEKKIKRMINEIGFYNSVLAARDFITKFQEIKI